MSQPIEAFYERELAFLEETVRAFAARYPASAENLVLQQGRSADPHLERLIEAFAILAGRVRHKIDSDFPELTESLLQILYPHLGLIIPSMAIAQASTKLPARAMCDGWRLEKDAPMRSDAFGEHGEYLQYGLGYPVTLWPVELTQASWETSPFAITMRPPRGTVALLRMSFSCKDGLQWEDLSLEKLRLHLSGQPQFMAGLYDLLFNRCLGDAFLAPDLGPDADTFKPPISLSAEEILFQVGLDVDEGLLPFPPESFLGYRLLMELLSFPQKFLFADLGGWSQIRGRGFGSQVEVLLFFSHSQENLERGLSAQNFLLGCAPVINAFRRSVEPIECNQRKADYRVAASRRQPKGMEIYRLESVRSIDGESGEFREFRPFYSSTFPGTDQRAAYFHATRRESINEEVPGTEIYISVVDPEFRPNLPYNKVLDIQAWCTNRDLPFKFQQAGDRLSLSGAAGENCWFNLLHKPTASLRPLLRRGTYWRLLGQNCLNHVSLVQGAEGEDWYSRRPEGSETKGTDLLQALHELLRLCDFSGVATQQLGAVNQQIIEGIRAVRSRPVLEPVKSTPSKIGMCRGMELQIDFDEEKLMGSGVILVASVLERFFALYTAVNSFTKLIAKTTQADGILKRWPARAGAHRLP